MENKCRRLGKDDCDTVLQTAASLHFFQSINERSFKGTFLRRLNLRAGLA